MGLEYRKEEGVDDVTWYHDGSRPETDQAPGDNVPFLKRLVPGVRHSSDICIIRVVW
jgi:hypothetical protein